MDATQPNWRTAAAHVANEPGGIGAIVRCLRVANHLTLAQFGRLCGYSAATVSRMERGKQPLRDVDVLDRFARILGVQPEVFGLTSLTSLQGRDTVAAATTKGDDVLRREFLLATGAALTAGRSTPENVSSSTSPDPAAMLARRLDLALTDPRTGQVVNPAVLPAMLRQARVEYQRTEYLPLSERLATLIASAEADAAQCPGPRSWAVLAETYTATALALFKGSASGLEWVAADRAIRSAHHADNPLLIANARRLAGIAYRRAGWHDRAQEVAVSTADHLGTGEHAMVTAELLCTGAYAAAKNGDQARAAELLADADRIAGKARQDGQYWTAFGPVNVTVYRVSVATAVGDLGAALAAVRAVNVGELPTVERRARFLVDAARAYSAADQHDQACRVLLGAARTAPQEVRTRPAARTLAAALARRSPRLATALRASKLA